MAEFNYIEYLRKNPLLTEDTKLTLDHFLKHIKDTDDAEEAYADYMETGTLDRLSDMDLSNISLELEDLNEIDVEREAGPVVDQYFTYIMDYFNNHHDDIYDMNNFLTALKHVTTTVTTTRDRFAQKTGHDGLD